MMEFAALFAEYPVATSLILAAAANYLIITFAGMFE
jgi:hypothetical protein